MGLKFSSTGPDRKRIARKRLGDRKFKGRFNAIRIHNGVKIYERDVGKKGGKVGAYDFAKDAKGNFRRIKGSAPEIKRRRDRLAAGGGGGGGGGGGQGQTVTRRSKADLALDRIVAGEFADDDRILRDERARLEAHRTTIGTAFDNYKSRMDQLIKMQSESTAQAGQEMVAASDRSAAAVAGMGGQAQADLAGREQLLGMTPGTTTGAAQGMAQTSAAYAAGNSAERVKQLSDAGLSASGGMTERAAIGERERIQALQRNENDIGRLAGKGEDLSKEKRGYRTKVRQEQQAKKMEQYVAILSLRSKAMTAKQDRKLRRELGLLDFKSDAAERASREQIAREGNASDERQNAADNATRRAVGRMGTNSTGGSGTPKGGLSPSEKKEWNQKKNHYASLANQYRRNVKKYSRSGAWNKTAGDAGGRLSHMDMVAASWIAKGGPIPKGVLTYLRSKFPGGKSPWG